MANINLAPGTKYLNVVRKRRRRLFILSGLLLFVMFLIWGGLFLVRGDLASENESVTNQISEVDVEIAELGDAGDRVIAFQNRLQAVDVLLNNHVSWDPLLNELERLLPHPTVLSSVTADLEKSSIAVEGTTTNVDLVAQTLASMNSGSNGNAVFTGSSFKEVSRETVGEGEEAQSRVIFSILFTFDPTSFSNNQ